MAIARTVAMVAAVSVSGAIALPVTPATGGVLIGIATVAAFAARAISVALSTALAVRGVFISIAVIVVPAPVAVAKAMAVAVAFFGAQVVDGIVQLTHGHVGAIAQGERIVQLHQLLGGAVAPYPHASRCGGGAGFLIGAVAGALGGAMGK